MAIDALVQPFFKVPIFAGLSPLQITEIARTADRIVYRPGDVIIRAESDADGAVLIVSGEALRVSGPRVSQGGEAVPAGSLLAEMAMIVETQHSSTVVARTSVRALKITRACVHAQIVDDPPLAGRFAHNISERLCALAEGLRDIDRMLAAPAIDPRAPSAAHG
jgi:CRP-like cAMP-binding protein